VSLIDRIFQTVEELKIEKDFLSEDDYLLDDTDEVVTREYELLADDGKGDHLEDASADTQWQKKFTEMLQKTGMTWSQCILPLDLASSPWFTALPERRQMAIGHAFATVPDLRFVDTTQSLNRTYKSTGDIPCLTAGTQHYMMCRDPIRPILGYECMLLHGGSRAWLDNRWSG
jgi:hypothetical protein